MIIVYIRSYKKAAPFFVSQKSGWAERGFPKGSRGGGEADGKFPKEICSPPPCSGAVKEKGAIAEDRAAEVGGENKHKHTLQTVAGEWYKDDGVKFMNEHCFFKNYKFFLKKLSQNWILEIIYYEKQKMDGAV